jgi:nitrite reductase (NO-forming)
MTAPTLIPPRETTEQVSADHHEEALPRQWAYVAVGLTAMLSLVGLIVALFALASKERDSRSVVATPVVQRATPVNPADAPAPTIAQAKGIKFEAFKPVDATLPAVPAGAVKKFHVVVFQHQTQVDPKLAPIEAWTYAVNGVAYRGVAASPPIVVNQGDKVRITLTNGGSKRFAVNMPHSIDFHSAEVAPNRYYGDIMPGKSETFSFVAKHAGVFMYHCATQPVLLHVGAGMAGMMVVRPRNLAPAAKELWITQSEYYIGKAGGTTDMAKLTAEKPDVIAFNGYANQYKTDPITVKRGEHIRMFVLNAGPSKWSAFHVIGTVFDTATIEGALFRDSQTVSLAPSQGGWVDFTLDQQGNYPFVTHSFGDMAKGAAGMLHTTGAPVPPKPSTMPGMKMGASKQAGAPAGATRVMLGEMYVHPATTTFKAGKVSFYAKNEGATAHMFMIERAPLKFDSPGMPAESAAQADSGLLQPGQSKLVTTTLKPGTYVLFCNVPGHYAAGQHTTITVS